MKKLISYSVISLFTLGVYSCRESEEVPHLPYPENLVRIQVMDPVQNVARDSVKTPDINDPDPPIRDGQDWRIRNTKK